MKPLGACWIAYGPFRICVGVAMVLFAPTTTLMFGALLGSGQSVRTHGRVSWLYVVVIVLSFVCGLLGIAGGLATQRNPKAGRSLLIVSGLLALMDLPLGVALGVCTLIVLWPAGQMKNAQAS